MKTTIHETSKHEPIIVMTRVFDAPRDIVWKAFTDPKHVKAWFGGHGFSNPVCEMDVRPGGAWHHVMRTPDGAEHAMRYVFVEVVKPSKLVWKSSDERKPGMHASPEMTVTLEENGRQTTWKLVARFDTLADRDQALGMGFTHVLAQGADKMNALVASLSGAAAEAPVHIP